MPVSGVLPHLQSPSVGNLRVGRGYCLIELEGESFFQDAGNCTLFEMTVKPTVLPHYSSRVGVRKKDYVATTELDATLAMTLEEITPRNLGLLLLGKWRESPSFPNIVIDMFQTPQLLGSVQFVDTSAVGPQWGILFPLVLFTPQKALGLIAQGSGTWSTVDLQVDVLFDSTTGQFAIATSASFLASGSA
jgi:hypothetical protein